MWPALAVLPLRRLTSVVSGAMPAAEDAQVAELAHELVVDRLEDLGDQRAVLGGQDLLLGAVGLGRAGAEAVDVVGAQAAGGDQVEQLAEAEVLAGADAEHRHELALGDRVVRGLAQLVGLDRLALRGSASSGLRRARRSARRPSDRPRSAAAGSRRGLRRATGSRRSMPENVGPWPTGTLNGTHCVPNDLADRRRGPSGSRRSRRPSW